ncbi:MAG: hypothetical protein Kow00121_11380 [Elainellaceae cyanobacterium]
MLERLQVLFERSDSAGSERRQAFQEAQQAFQQILALDLEGLEPAMAMKLQSYQTEINRLLRLLGMDVMFLQAARQSATNSQRQQQMGDRLGQLRQFCEAVLEAE